MINIKSIGCGLAFAPYILESLKLYLETGRVNPSVVRQAATGLIIRSEDELIIHYQNRDAILNPEEAQHYLTTIGFRAEVFEISRYSDEVVLMNVSNAVLLSHPQSEMWIEKSVIPNLLAAFNGENDATQNSLPDWLTISGGDGRLLLSDGRTGRWVLLGQDHYVELARRQPRLDSLTEKIQVEKPPTIPIKGLKLNLQAAFKLAETLEEYAETGSFLPYEEFASTYSLQVMQTNEGMKITDGELLISVLPKEARKWAAFIETELDKLKARIIKRGRVKTVFAKVDSGCWVLQGGDEIILPGEIPQTLPGPLRNESVSERLVAKTTDDFKVFLDKTTGACGALNDHEYETLKQL